MHPTSDEVDLARRIVSCPNLLQTLDGAPSPCSSIIEWQTEQFVKIGLGPDAARRRHQVPEPWSGSLSTARVLFISSNPSFGIDDHFPDATWSGNDVVDFLTRRFVQRGERPFGALDGPTQADQDRSIVVDSAGRQALSKRVRTWQVLRSRAAAILGLPIADTRASEHYALTEVVRCKSQREVGVLDALETCVDRWLSETLRLSPARLLVVSGAPAGMAVKRTVELLTGGTCLPDEWGSWRARSGAPSGGGRWPMSWSELRRWREEDEWTLTEQENHTIELDLMIGGEGRSYTIVWLPHPVKSVPQQLTDQTLIHPDLLERWRTAAGPV